MSIIQDSLIKALEKGSLKGSGLLELYEKDIIRNVMRVCKYNQSKAAINLGISRGGLRSKLKHHFGEEFV